MKKTVLISSGLYADSFAMLENDFRVLKPKEGCHFSREELLNRISDCDALLSMFTCKVDKELIAAAPNLKIISNFGVGYNNIDVAFASQQGIVVTNTPHPVTEPTAELTMALLLALTRRLSELDTLIRTPEKVRWGVMENIGTTVYGKTLGIVGMGRIGQAVARRAVASGMHIVYYSRHRASEEVEKQYNATYLTLDDLLRTSDVVSLHIPLTDETHHLLSAEKLRLMKPSALLINTARGAVVDEQALATALHEGRIGGAALDVYEHEPAITPELLTAPHTLLVPHIGTATRETRYEMAAAASLNIINFFAGKPITQVNK